MNENYDIFDLSKLILALMVLCIHANPFGSESALAFPITRAAVPLFFMISSFLFFQKYDQENRTGQITRLKKYSVRLLRLYLFWFVVLLPITLYVRKSYFAKGALRGIFLFVRGFFLGSTFIASWYLMALLIGIILICLLSKVLPNYVLVLLGGVLYLVCCAGSNYANADFVKHSILNSVIRSYPGHIYNGFPVAIIWVALGKCFVDKKQRKTGGLHVLLALACFVLLLMEQYLINVNEFSKANDCYLALVPLCYCVFAMIRSTRITLNNPRTLREFSTALYCVHATLAGSLREVLGRFFDVEVYPLSAIITIIVLVICIGIFSVLKYLSTKPKLEWIRSAF